MRFNASVTDRNGRAIGGMRESDFTVWENGIERRVTNVAPANEPFNLVLLLDVSGSVEERMDFIRKAARDFLRTTSPQDRISIISFRDDIQVISDFSTDRAMLSRKLDEIDAGGGTALYDALGYVLSEPLKRLRGERTAIVVMSDGDDNKSFLPFPAILEALLESGALVYPLYVPSGLIPESSVPRPEITIDPLRTRYLTLTTRAEEEGRKLAAASGGIYYPIRRLEDLQKAYDDVVAQLRSAYTITYASNSVSSSPRVRVRTNRDGASVRLSPVVELEHALRYNFHLRIVDNPVNQPLFNALFDETERRAVNCLPTNKLDQDRTRSALRLRLGRRRNLELQRPLVRPLVLHAQRRERATAREVLSLNQHAHSFSSGQRIESSRTRQTFGLCAAR